MKITVPATVIHPYTLTSYFASICHGKKYQTVGGLPLAELLKKVASGGSVACCGNAAGLDLPTSVLPFILRGVNLLGVDSVEIPLEEKKQIWSKLASEWRCPKTESSAKVIGRDDLDTSLKAYLKGQSSGKIVLDHSIQTSSKL